jgi:hypothetical protein
LLVLQRKCLRELSVLVLLPLIREHEHEADEVAMLLLAQARVDPTIAIDVGGGTDRLDAQASRHA